MFTAYQEQRHTAENDAEITLPSGIYVVKAGEKVVKVAL